MFHSETLGALSEPVIEQVEITAKFWAISTARGRRCSAPRTTSSCATARAGLHAGVGPVHRGAAEAAETPARDPGPNLASRGVTPAAISLLLVHLKKGRVRGLRFSRRHREKAISFPLEEEGRCCWPARGVGRRWWPAGIVSQDPDFSQRPIPRTFLAGGCQVDRIELLEENSSPGARRHRRRAGIRPRSRHG